MIPSFPHPLTMTFSAAEHLANDVETHTLYLGKHKVDILPIRRVLTRTRKLRDSVILLNDITPSQLSLLLRIKHVVLNFTTDFSGESGVVPGLRFVGKIPLRQAIVSGHRKFSPKDKLFVFPYSACWLQRQGSPCENCVSAQATDLTAYETHRRAPCGRSLMYGRLLDGGLQDYIRIPSPAHTLIRVPEQVSLHDCCFLLDVALPFFSFCVDTLLSLLAESPRCRVLVILSDIERETNDCLLVLRHCRLDHSRFTFTDPRVLRERPDLAEKYTRRFQHVLVFSPEDSAFDDAVRFGATASFLKLTLTLFRGKSDAKRCPRDRTLRLFQLAYKDKFLMEELLETLAALNEGRMAEFSPFISVDRTDKSQAADSSSALSTSDLSQHSVPVSEAVSSPATPCVSLFLGTEEHGEKPPKAARADRPAMDGVRVVGAARRHVSWLHCDRDLLLCLDESCFHGAHSGCEQTRSINRMLASGSQLERVFYTQRLACHVKLNAFIF